MMPEQHGLCLPRFVWLQPLLSAQPAKIEINSELLIWHNSLEEWVHWLLAFMERAVNVLTGIDMLYMDLPFLPAIVLPKPLSASSSPHDIPHSIAFDQGTCLAEMKSGDGLMQWRPVGHPHGDGETGRLVSNCIHGFWFIFAGSFILVASFVLKSFPWSPYIPVYPHRFQFGPPLLTLCPSFLPGSDLDDFMPDSRCKSNSLTW